MPRRFHGLKKVKLRQSWNKYNLYNLSRAEAPLTNNRTFFQQKWSAKSITRAYHGETVREKQWQRMFRPYIRSVVPMDHTYLGKTDGSDEAAGRGSGKDVGPDQRVRKPQRTPYMNMVFAELERRLDTAIFRALFASSTRQARQFCVHGCVKVNGKKMIYPGYRLNPGDMFQVEPDRVLFATGAVKDKKERRAGRVYRARTSAKDKEAPDSAPEDTSSPQATPNAEPPLPKDPKTALSHLLEQAKAILSKPSDDLTAKRKQSLRAFQQTLKRTISRPNTLTDSIDAQLQEMAHKLNISLPDSSKSEPDAYDSPTPTPSSSNQLAKSIALSDAEKSLLKAALADARENPIDPSKPYATPWRPREYLSAFAFVPRYLEVHHKVCSAVYLRHPVARPGLAEVPTPYNIEQNGLAFNWYLRRR